VVVDNLNRVGLAIAPLETDTELIVDANRILSCTIALESFESIAGRQSQRINSCRGIELVQLASGYIP
jgi:hypothetical protein